MSDWTPASLLAADPFAGLLGVTLVSETPLAVSLEVGERHTNFLGVGHGGVVYSLADVALSLASNAGGTRSLMVDSHLVLTAASRVGDILTATAVPLATGRTLATYRIEVTGSGGRMVAGFTGTVIRRPGEV